MVEQMVAQLYSDDKKTNSR